MWPELIKRSLIAIDEDRIECRRTIVLIAILATGTPRYAESVALYLSNSGLLAGQVLAKVPSEMPMYYYFLTLDDHYPGLNKRRTI